MKLRASLTVVVTLLFAVPGIACAAPVAPVNDDELLDALEIKFLAHTDSHRTPLGRLQNMERFVYGNTRTGNIHDRVSALIATTNTSLSNAPTVHSVSRAAISRASLPAARSAFLDDTSINNLPTAQSASMAAVKSIQSPIIKHGRPEGTYRFASAKQPVTETVDRAGSSLRSLMSDSTAIADPNRASTSRVETMVDRIERLELGVFGRKECAKRLQLRVSRLEERLVGSSGEAGSKSLTERVDELCAIVNRRTSARI